MSFVKARRVAAVVGVLLIGAASGLAGASPASAVSHALISGTGSSWSANAVNQWITDVTSTGLQVVFTGSGSAQGRKDFANAITDFAVSDIGYQGSDPVTGEQDTNCPSGTASCRAFAYEPIVAGGTSFPYQIQIGGQLVRNLRLSGETLAKIFTYQITNWNDPQITKDNNGHALPDLHIIPVVNSQGSGSTAQFSAYLADQYPSIWQAFVHTSGATEYWPPPSGGQAIAQSGSDGIMNFVSSGSANGAIGYDEYSYPLAKQFPVAKIENKAGYYTLPDQYNVAVALTKAQINMDKNSPNYLLQDLHYVYSNPDKRTYPLSSYSYFLIPTAANDARMSTAKRQTLADYLYFSVCQGQKEMGPIGYSPLPINLVQASFAQTAKLKAADPGVDLTQRDVSTCQNPTFVAGHPEINHLAQIAPLPQACDQNGAGPCTTDNSGVGPAPTSDSPSSSGPHNGNSTGPHNGNSTGPHNGNSTGPHNGHSNNSGSSGPSAASSSGQNTSVNPQGGSSGGPVVPAGGSGSGSPVVVVNPDGTLSTAAAGAGVVTDNSSGAVAGPQAAAAQTVLADYRQQNMTGIWGPLAVIELLAVLLAPPLVYAGLRRRRSRP